MDPVHRISFSEITHYSSLIWRSCEKVLSLRKIYKIALQTSKPHIFPTTTSNSVIFVPKIPESLLLLLFAFLIHMFVAFIHCLCLFAFGTVVSELFIEDFQEQAFDESQFLFEDQ
jgi:hypothetical protein